MQRWHSRRGFDRQNSTEERAGFIKYSRASHGSLEPRRSETRRFNDSFHGAGTNGHFRVADFTSNLLSVPPSSWPSFADNTGNERSNISELARYRELRILLTLLARSLRKYIIITTDGRRGRMRIRVAQIINTRVPCDSAIDSLFISRCQ